MIQIAFTHHKKISIVSPSLPHLKKGARRDVLEIMKDWHLYNEAQFNRTDNVYFIPGGGHIEFFGVDNSGKVRGPGRDILYINECNLISRTTYLGLTTRTTECVFIDYNPADEDHWVYKVADSLTNKKILSTYKHNRANLTDSQIQDIEATKIIDEAYYRTFALGERGSSTAKIYPNWSLCTSLPQKGKKIYGLDFGYSDPCALIEVVVHEKGWYANELIYESGLTTSDIIAKMKGLRVSKSLPIYCDSAEPDRILELQRAGYNAKKSNKNVKNGIIFVNSHHKFVTETSANIQKELKSYKWIQREDNTITDEVCGVDHALDAIRYALYTHYIQPAPNHDGKNAKTQYTKEDYIKDRVKRN